MMNYDLTECRMGDIHLGPDSHLLWPSIVILGILLTLLRATNSRLTGKENRESVRLLTRQIECIPVYGKVRDSPQ